MQDGGVALANWLLPKASDNRKWVALGGASEPPQRVGYFCQKGRDPLE